MLFNRKTNGESRFSYIDPKFLNRRAIITFGLELAALLIIIVVVIGVLQYLRIISIEELFWGGNDGNKIGKVAPSKPKKAISQGISYSMPGENSRNDSKNEKETKEKARKIGYEIITMEDNDTTGRSVFYVDRGAYGYGGLGIRIVSNRDGSTYLHSIVGKFLRIENIAGSEDKYLVLEDPVAEKEHQSIRLILDSSPGSKNPLTSLVVENLDVMTSSETVRTEPKLLGSVKDHYKDLQKLLKKGDAVVLQMYIDSSDLEHVVNVKDEKSYYIGYLLAIRRFKGEAEISKELDL